MNPILILLPLLVLVGCQTTKTTPTDLFAAADTNHDGALSLNEASDSVVSGVFLNLDENNDGQLTSKECTVEGDPAMMKEFRARDTDSSNTLSRVEVMDYTQRKGVVGTSFRKADVNKDGQLTRTEVKSFYAESENPN